MFKVFSILLLTCVLASGSLRAQDCYNTKLVKIQYVGIQDKAVWPLTVEMGVTPMQNLQAPGGNSRPKIEWDRHIYVDSTSFCLFVDYINKQKSDDSIADRDGFVILSTTRNGNSLSRFLGSGNGLISKYLTELVQLLKSEKANGDLIWELEFMYRKINY